MSGQVSEDSVTEALLRHQIRTFLKSNETTAKVEKLSVELKQLSSLEDSYPFEQFWKEVGMQQFESPYFIPYVNKTALATLLLVVNSKGAVEDDVIEELYKKAEDEVFKFASGTMPMDCGMPRRPGAHPGMLCTIKRDGVETKGTVTWGPWRCQSGPTYYRDEQGKLRFVSTHQVYARGQLVPEVCPRDTTGVSKKRRVGN